MPPNKVQIKEWAHCKHPGVWTKTMNFTVYLTGEKMETRKLKKKSEI